MKKDTSNILVISILILVILVLAGGGGLFYMMSSFVKTPFNPGADKQVFTIKPGQNLGGIAQSLEKDAIISNRTFFKLLARYKKAGRKLQAGEYLLSASDSPERVLEIGTSLGIATTYMASGAPQATITTLEGCPETAQIAKEYFQKQNLNNINVIIGEFDQSLDQISKSKPFDLIFFDGNHQKEATIRYFKKCLELAHDQSIFIFDDIHWSKGMEAAWEEIKNHKKVSMTVDTYKWGLVFFSKGREKQHFTIRI